MPRPFFRSNGTLVEQATGASLVVGMPSSWSVGDILIVTWMHNNSPSATPSGWDHRGEFRVSSKSLTVLVRRAQSGDSGVTLGLTGGGSIGNTAAVMHAYGGCPPSGAYYEASNGGTDSTVDTNFSTGALTSLGPLRLMVASGATHGDTGGARWSTPGGANVANVAERFDQGWTQGLGGAVAHWSAEKDVAGSGCTITAQKDVTSPERWWAAFLIPADDEQTRKAIQTILVG